ncbi:hypothetical protein MKEN_00486400 [Mycena kentingensis (nom. inval.)]|nr:hypothetical protein MKEN_00486400 [Mycena kentingensis (nom. inval.)]
MSKRKKARKKLVYAPTPPPPKRKQKPSKPRPRKRTEFDIAHCDLLVEFLADIDVGERRSIHVHRAFLQQHPECATHTAAVWLAQYTRNEAMYDAKCELHRVKQRIPGQDEDTDDNSPKSIFRPKPACTRTLTSADEVSMEDRQLLLLVALNRLANTHGVSVDVALEVLERNGNLRAADAALASGDWRTAASSGPRKLAHDPDPESPPAPRGSYLSPEPDQDPDQAMMVDDDTSTDSEDDAPSRSPLFTQDSERPMLVSDGSSSSADSDSEDGEPQPARHVHPKQSAPPTRNPPRNPTPSSSSASDSDDQQPRPAPRSHPAPSAPLHGTTASSSSSSDSENDEHQSPRSPLFTQESPRPASGTSSRSDQSRSTQSCGTSEHDEHQFPRSPLFTQESAHPASGSSSRSGQRRSTQSCGTRSPLFTQESADPRTPFSTAPTAGNDILDDLEVTQSSQEIETRFPYARMAAVRRTGPQWAAGVGDEDDESDVEQESDERSEEGGGGGRAAVGRGGGGYVEIYPCWRETLESPSTRRVTLVYTALTPPSGRVNKQTFTPEDDDLLVGWLSEIPDPKDRGKWAAYSRLDQDIRFSAHSSYSWRSRYRNHVSDFNSRIDAYELEKKLESTLPLRQSRHPRELGSFDRRALNSIPLAELDLLAQMAAENLSIVHGCSADESWDQWKRLGSFASADTSLDNRNWEDEGGYKSVPSVDDGTLLQDEAAHAPSDADPPPILDSRDPTLSPNDHLPLVDLPGLRPQTPSASVHGILRPSREWFTPPSGRPAKSRRLSFGKVRYRDANGEEGSLLDLSLDARGMETPPSVRVSSSESTARAENTPRVDQLRVENIFVKTPLQDEGDKPASSYKSGSRSPRAEDESTEEADEFEVVHLLSHPDFACSPSSQDEDPLPTNATLSSSPLLAQIQLQPLPPPPPPPPQVQPKQKKFFFAALHEQLQYDPSLLPGFARSSTNSSGSSSRFVFGNRPRPAFD